MIIKKAQLLYWSLQEQFGREMFHKAWKKIEDGNNRRPDPWKFDLTFLQGRLQDEIKEYATEKEWIAKADELLDIANFCFYLWVAIINDWQETARAFEAKDSSLHTQVKD
jgi:hypothetical protein